MTVTVELDYLQCVQLIAACQQREAIFEQHVLNGVPEPVVYDALRDTLAAELAIRAAFRLPKPEAVLDAIHEAAHRDLDELAEADDIPLALTADGIPEAFASYQADLR